MNLAESVAVKRDGGFLPKVCYEIRKRRLDWRPTGVSISPDRQPLRNLPFPVVTSPSLLRFDEPSSINDVTNLVIGGIAGYRAKAAKMGGGVPGGGR